MARIACFLLVATTPLLSGCASIIARTGTDLYCLKSKEEVQAKLGKPVATGMEDGEFFEEYRTRRKIAEQWPARCSGIGYAMLVTMTCGTSELISVPNELFILGRRTLLGQPIRVTYGEDGSVKYVRLDEPSMWEPQFERTRVKEESKE